MKLKQKIDLLFWAFMWILPVFIFFVTYYRSGLEVDFIHFIDMNFAFPFIHDILDNVWNTAFGSTFSCSGYLSYLVAVEIAHCLFDVVVFIPRFAHSLIERSESLCQRK